MLTKRVQFWVVRLVATYLLQILEATWNVHIIGADGRQIRKKSGEKRIYTFWHRHLLTMLCVFKGAPISVPVSEHQDGEYVAQVMKAYGFRAVRGSTTRGSLKLLKGLLAEIKKGRSCAITPDGPKGPCYSVQPGFALLSEKADLPVCSVGVAVDRAWVFSSWDRFVVPKPFSTITIRFGEEIYPRRDKIDNSKKQLKEKMFKASENASESLKHLSDKKDFQGVDLTGYNQIDR